MDSDDAFHPEALESLLVVAKSTGADVVTAGYACVPDGLSCAGETRVYDDPVARMTDDRTWRGEPWARLMHTELFAVQVFDKEELIGFYLMKQNADVLHILYLYYEEAQKTKVFASIQDHVKRMKIEQCVTEHKPLADYLRKEIYFPKHSVYEISFSVPNGMELPQDGQVQYGDGDCFTA